MKVFKIETNELGENCYIVSDGKDAAVIDPGGCAEEIIKKCEGLSVRAVLLTHGHFDHIIAVRLPYIFIKTMRHASLTRKKAWRRFLGLRTKRQNMTKHTERVTLCL